MLLEAYLIIEGWMCTVEGGTAGGRPGSIG